MYFKLISLRSVATAISCELGLSALDRPFSGEFIELIQRTMMRLNLRLQQRSDHRGLMFLAFWQPLQKMRKKLYTRWRQVYRDLRA